MSSAAVTAEAPYEKKPIRYRFRKIWRAVLFIGLVPFFAPSLITAFIPVPDEIVKFFAGVVVLVPLSTFIEVVTEDLIERLGQLVGGLLHAFFGNIAYFVLTATALVAASSLPQGNEERNNIVHIVQSSIAGTIVIDLLFILGVSIFIGSMRNGRMQFSAEYSNQYAEMLTVAVIALALPTLASKLATTGGSLGFGAVAKISSDDIIILSNVTAIILIIAYLGYLGWTVFRFRDIQAKPENPEEVKEALRGDELGPFAPGAVADEEARQALQYAAMEAAATLKRAESAQQAAQAAASLPPPDPSAVVEVINARLQKQTKSTNGKGNTETKAEKAAKNRNRGIEWWELVVLVAGAGGVVFISENMAKVFENGQLTSQLGLNTFFVGFILLPVASNLVELSAAVSTAWHNRLETCLAVTAGSSIQVSLLVAPLLVLVATVVNVPEMTLTFSYFVLAIFALIAYLFQIITVDGETTWLEGLQLTSFFAVIVAVALLAG